MSRSTTVPQVRRKPLAPAQGTVQADHGGGVMRLLLWKVAAMLILAAAMLIAGVGAAGLWFAVIAVGVAVVVIDRLRSHHA